MCYTSYLPLYMHSIIITICVLQLYMYAVRILLHERWSAILQSSCFSIHLTKLNTLNTVCLYWSICDVLSDAGADLLLGAVFSLSLWQANGFLSHWRHEWKFLAWLHWCLMGGKRKNKKSLTYYQTGLVVC